MLRPFILTSAMFISSIAQSQSPWHFVAHEYGVEPSLLYAVALRESGYGVDGGLAAHPYTIRYAGNVARFDNPYDYQTFAEQVVEQYRPYEIDLGPFQINLKWQAHRFSDWRELLDPVFNMQIGAAVLQEALDASDSVLQGVGRYLTWNEEKHHLAKQYAENVLELKQKIESTTEF